MPITFPWPVVDTPFGPGYEVAASSTIQPVPLDWNWRFWVWYEDEINVLISWIIASGGGDVRSKFGITTTNQRPFSDNRRPPPAQATVHLVAELIDTNTQQIQDTGSVSVKWEPIIGLYDYLPQRISIPSQVTGGFGQADRDMLGRVEDAVYRPWPYA